MSKSKASTEVNVTTTESKQAFQVGDYVKVLPFTSECSRPGAVEGDDDYVSFTDDEGHSNNWCDGMDGFIGNTFRVQMVSETRGYLLSTFPPGKEPEDFSVFMIFPTYNFLANWLEPSTKEAALESYEAVRSYYAKNIEAAEFMMHLKDALTDNVAGE